MSDQPAQAPAEPRPRPLLAAGRGRRTRRPVAGGSDARLGADDPGRQHRAASRASRAATSTMPRSPSSPNRSRPAGSSSRSSSGPHGHRFQIVAGERRWRAAQKARLHEVPAIVREFSDEETLEVALIENIQRADLNAIEEAQAYGRLMADFGHTQEELGKLVHKSRSHVANLLRLLDLPEPAFRPWWWTARSAWAMPARWSRRPIPRRWPRRWCAAACRCARPRSSPRPARRRPGRSGRCRRSMPTSPRSSGSSANCSASRVTVRHSGAGGTLALQYSYARPARHAVPAAHRRRDLGVVSAR